MENTFIPKGMEIVKQAVVADNNDELEKSLALYREGLKYFMTGLKYMKNERSKEMIRSKMDTYFDRAEQIKEALKAKAGKSDKKKAVMAGGVSKRKSDSNGDSESEDEDKDPETTKLQNALSSVIVTETPNVKWNDVAGLEAAKGLLQEAVIIPIKFPKLFTGKRKPWAGILMYGPPGTGKSYLAKAVATESGASCFLSVAASDLVSKFQGESERLVKNLFELARKNAPSIIFLDEIDSLCGARGDGDNEAGRRIKTEFLIQMDGVGKSTKGVLVLGATNTPWQLDPAIRRRFQKRVYIPLPEVHARQVMFKLHIGDTPNELDERDWKKLAKNTDGFSGSDIGVVVRDALYEPVRTCQVATHFMKVPDPEGKFDYLYEPCSPGHLSAIEMNLMSIEGDQLRPENLMMRHFEKCLHNAKASVDQGDLKRFEDWTQQFGLEG